MITDGTLGLTYTATGPRVVKTYLLWSREYDGRVSFWIISRDKPGGDGRLLRYVFGMYPSFEEVMNMFCFEPGNGHIHSSKGLGRKLIATAIAVEQARCDSYDAARMGSMLILRAPSKDRAKMQPIITSPFVVIDKEIEVDQAKFTSNGENFWKMDDRLTMAAQQNVGAYIQGASGVKPGEGKTATEATIDNQREQEFGASILDRFMGYFYLMIGLMQRRAYSDDKIEAAQRIFDVVKTGQRRSAVPRRTKPSRPSWT